MSKDNYMEVISIDGRKKRSKDTSELIIDTAFSLLNEGILNITHELIAKEAKIGTRTIFRHFKDKNSLIIGMHNKLLNDFESSKPKIDLNVDINSSLLSNIERQFSLKLFYSWSSKLYQLYPDSCFVVE